MNTEVIKEIAKQLGIAANQVSADIIPAYAQYVIAKSATVLIIGIVCLIAALAVHRMYKNDNYHIFDDDDVMAVLFLILLVISVFCLAIGIQRIVVWSISPAGAFVSMLLNH